MIRDLHIYIFTLYVLSRSEVTRQITHLYSVQMCVVRITLQNKVVKDRFQYGNNKKNLMKNPSIYSVISTIFGRLDYHIWQIDYHIYRSCLFSLSEAKYLMVYRLETQ